MKRFASPQNLKLAWNDLKANGGHAAGIDGLSFRDYSPGEMFSVLRAVEAALLAGNYHPYPVRIHEIIKPSGGIRSLSIQTIPDRVVAKAFQQCFDGYWRQVLPGYGRSVVDLFCELERYVRRHGTYFIQIEDIQNCYPSAPLDKIVECQNRHFAGADLRWLAEQVVRGHEGFERRTGIGQGSPYSPVAVKTLLHHHFDTELEARYQGTLPSLRYVDNLTFGVKSKRQGQEISDLANSILNELGFNLKPNEGCCIDLRDPAQNKKLLGLVPRWQDGQLMFSIPDKAYKRLNDRLLEATITDYPERSAELVVNGWLNASGPALTNAVREEVISNVISNLRTFGFTQMNRKDLLATAKEARNAWLNRSRD